MIFLHVMVFFLIMKVPRRGETFVTRKITRGLSRINYGLEKCIYLGNLDAKRDWGHAKDYVHMQWLMLQQEKPEDYVIASGQMKSVREFVELSAMELGWNKEKGGKSIIWENSGIDEIGKRADTGQVVVKLIKDIFDQLKLINCLVMHQKLGKNLKWKPKISLGQLIAEMIEKILMKQKKNFY